MAAYSSYILPKKVPSNTDTEKKDRPHKQGNGLIYKINRILRSFVSRGCRVRRRVVGESRTWLLLFN